MNSTKYKIAFLTLVTLIYASGSLQAQSKAGTTIGQFLKIEPSSRAAAMGNAGASLSGEASSVFFNAGALGRLNTSEVQFTHNSWLADISYNYANASAAVPGLGTFAIQATSLTSGEIDVRTVEQPLGTGERYTVTNFALGLGYGLMLTDRVSVGVLINYFQESIWHCDMTGFGMNFGVQYQVEKDGLTLGASVANFGPRTGYDGRDLYIDYDFSSTKYGDNDQIPAELRTEKYPLPTIFRAGISLPIKFNAANKILIAADAVHPNDNKESVNIGAEYTFMENFCLRAGYRNLFLDELERGLTFGAGVKVWITDDYNMKADYAYADYGKLLKVHRFSIGIGF